MCATLSWLGATLRLLLSKTSAARRMHVFLSQLHNKISDRLVGPPAVCTAPPVHAIALVAPGHAIAGGVWQWRPTIARAPHAMYPWNDSREPRVDVDPQDKELVAAARASWVRARERWLVTHRAIAAASGELQIQREKFQRRQQAEACSRTALDVLLPPHDAAPRDVRRRLALDDAAPSDVRSYHTSDWRTITTLGWCDSEDESKLLDVEEALAVEEEEEAAAAARTRSWVSSEPGASPPTSACTGTIVAHALAARRRTPALHGRAAGA